MNSLNDIPYSNKKVSQVSLVVRKVIFPILLIFFLFWLYTKTFCLFSGSYENARIVCSHNWKAGLFLVGSYSIVKSVSISLGFDTIFKRLAITLLLYSFSFALLAFPYWVISFLQPLYVNSFLHTLVIILGIEKVFQFNKHQV